MGGGSSSNESHAPAHIMKSAASITENIIPNQNFLRQPYGVRFHDFKRFPNEKYTRFQEVLELPSLQKSRGYFLATLWGHALRMTAAEKTAGAIAETAEGRRPPVVALPLRFPLPFSLFPFPSSLPFRAVGTLPTGMEGVLLIICLFYAICLQLLSFISRMRLRRR